MGLFLYPFLSSKPFPTLGNLALGALTNGQRWAALYKLRKKYNMTRPIQCSCRLLSILLEMRYSKFCKHIYTGAAGVHPLWANDAFLPVSDSPISENFSEPMQKFKFPFPEKNSVFFAKISYDHFTWLCVIHYFRTMGPSVKYVTLFLANFYPLPCHTLSHIPGPPESTSHISDPRFLVRLVQRNRTKAPCTNSLSIVRGGFCPGVLSGGLLSGRFCPGWFLSVPLLSEHICYNKKLNITLNFMFHMYDKKNYI